jgi:hypothetical protein
MPLKPEQIEHINLVNWFNYNFPELSDDFHHFANERRCSVQEGRLLKRMAVKRGVSDFFLAIPLSHQYKDGNKHFSGLWIELKVGKNKPTKEQIYFANRKIDKGYHAVFVWGFNQAKESIVRYLEPYISDRDKNTPKNLNNVSSICRGVFVLEKSDTVSIDFLPTA